jgi:hypothetical protein
MSQSRKKNRRDHPAAGKPAPAATGTEHSHDDERALRVVTAFLLTPDEFPGELGESYGDACAALGLQATRHGWGLALAQDDHGARWTQITTDVSGISYTMALWNSHLSATYQAPPDNVTAVRPGWPIQCSLGYVDLEPPHDPEDIPAADLLRPAAEHGWTPAKRRAMADALTDELTDLLHRDRKDYVDAYRFDLANLGEPTLETPPARIIDMLTDADPSSPSVEHALAQAWALANTTKPPPASIRVKEATRRARMVRAAGHGWTFLARTDGPTVLLLDEAPGAALQIDADGTHLSDLLDALTAAADRIPH